MLTERLNSALAELRAERVSQTHALSGLLRAVGADGDALAAALSTAQQEEQLLQSDDHTDSAAAAAAGHSEDSGAGPAPSVVADRRIGDGKGAPQSPLATRVPSHLFVEVVTGVHTRIEQVLTVACPFLGFMCVLRW